MSPRLVSSGELAHELGLHRRTITRYVQLGWLTPKITTPGGQYRFDVAEARAEMDRIRKRLQADT